MKHVIRLAVEADADAINEVSKFLGYTALSMVEATEKLKNIIRSDFDIVYVAEVEGKIVGWLHLFYAHRLASDDFYEIGGLVVNPSCRGLGIGRDLVSYVLDKHKGKVRVRCNEARVESHLFYEAIGFKSNKVQRVFEVC